MKREKGSVQHTLSTEVIKRFLAEDQFQDFLKKYNEIKNPGNMTDRFNFLAQTLGAEDLEMLNFYLTDRTKGIKEYAKGKNLSYGSVYGRVVRIGVRALFQLVEKNPGLLEQLEVAE